MGSFDLKEQFSSWEQKVSDDEWYFCNLREALVDSSNQEKAFKEIPCIVEFILQTDDEFICTECFELLLSLARKSETTETPSMLVEKWDALSAHMGQFGGYQQRKFNELSAWYRQNAL